MRVRGESGKLYLVAISLTLLWIFSFVDHFLRTTVERTVRFIVALLCKCEKYVFNSGKTV